MAACLEIAVTQRTFIQMTTTATLVASAKQMGWSLLHKEIVLNITMALECFHCNSKSRTVQNSASTYTSHNYKVAKSNITNTLATTNKWLSPQKKLFYLCTNICFLPLNKQQNNIKQINIVHKCSKFKLTSKLAIRGNTKVRSSNQILAVDTKTWMIQL